MRPRDRPVPKYAGTVRCIVRRYNAGISGSIYPKYELALAVFSHCYEW